MTGRLRAVALLGVLAVACGASVSEPPTDPILALTPVVTRLNFPLFLTAPPGDTSRLFVVEKGGAIRIVKRGALLPTAFLNITALTTKGGEQGLLGLAFSPDYAQSGRFYVSYTAAGGGNAGHSVIARYHVSSDPDIAGTADTVILTVDQPYANHNGGNIIFGPDGMLYFGLGDGGSGGDPKRTGQDRTDLLGSMLRLDVSGSSYTIPAGNPYVGSPTFRGELWNYGLRNPWRWSFDRLTGDLYIADVGQNQYEEVDVVPAGAGGGQNFGWSDMEGTHCFNDANCASNPAIRPVLDYSHSNGCSITGGYVYRGTAVPAIQGLYFYADYCAGSLWSFRWSPAGITERKKWSLNTGGGITSFGEDGRGDLYLLSNSGTVYRFAAP